MVMGLVTRLQQLKQVVLQLHFHYHFHYHHLLLIPTLLLELKPAAAAIANATTGVTAARHHSRLFGHTSCLCEDTCNNEGYHFCQYRFLMELISLSLRTDTHRTFCSNPICVLIFDMLTS
jgi:hypothetical protein